MTSGLKWLVLMLLAFASHAAAQDRFLAAGQVSQTAAVAGDLLAAGGEVDVAAEVGGDAAVSGGSVRIDGAVGQDLYAAGGRLALHAAVKRNARLAGGNVEIGERAKIAGNVSLAGGSVRINGAIGGDVNVAAGRLELGPNARIGGRLRYTSGEELRRDPGAQVQGGVETVGPPPGGPSEGAARALGWLWSIGLLVLAAILAALAPGLFAGGARWGRALLVGVIALICIPVLALVAAVTVIGLPLALVAIALFLALLLLGYVWTGISLGTAGLQRFRAGRASVTGWRVVAAVLGMLVLTLLARVPWLGGAVALVAIVLGLGALLLRLRPGTPAVLR